MSIKTVKRTRTYFNKTLNEWVTKEYEYELVKVDGKTTTRSRKSIGKELIVGKKGIYEDRLKELLATAEDPAVKADIKAKAKEALRKGERLSKRSLLAKVSESKIEKFFINAGYSEADIMAELGMNLDEWEKNREILYDEANWENSTFTWNGIKYKLKFQAKYTGSVLEVVR